MNAAASLKPYMVWGGLSPLDGAVLVFAHNCRQAKTLGFQSLRSWNDHTVYIETRVRLQRDHGDWLQRLADPEALAAGRAHVVEDPACCSSCQTWGTPLLPEGICIRCDADALMGVH